jgi:HlyD family secretion protein
VHPETTPPVKPATVAVSRGDVRQVVVAPGQLIGTREVMLTMSASGVLTEWNVRPGQWAREGDALARLGNLEQLEVEVTQARIALAEAQQALDNLYTIAHMEGALALLGVEAAQRALEDLNSPELREAQALQAIAEAEKSVENAERIYQLTQSTASQADIDAAFAQVVLAEDNLSKAEERYKPFADKPEDNLTRANLLAKLSASRQAFEQAVRSYNAMTGTAGKTEQAVAAAELATAQANLAEAHREWERIQAGPTPGEIMFAEAELTVEQARYDSLVDGNDPEELAEAENNLSLALTTLTIAEKRLAGAELRAPFDGIILDVLARQGESVLAGQSLILLADPTALEVRVTVIEEDLPLVEIGQAAELYFDAQPDATTFGQVLRIVSKRVAGEDRPLYHVFLSIDEPVAKVVSGMTVDTAIIVAEANNVLRLPRSVVRAGSDDTAQINGWSGGEVIERLIKIGMRGDVFVEILEGVQEGDEVVGE